MTQVVAINSVKAWLAEFLLTRGCFQGATAKPLHSYQLTSDEFVSLNAILTESRGYAFHPVFGAAWAAGFCLFVSECYRREYDASGGWSWSGFERKLNCDFNPQQRTKLVTIGLKNFWKRPIRERSNGRDLLGSLFLEGGLPWPLVQSETHGFGRAIRKGLKNFYRAHTAGRTVCDVLIDCDRYLPQTFRNLDTRQLLAGIVEQLMYLVDTFPLKDQVDPILYLDNHVKDWRYDFPIPLDEENATILISEWLMDAGKRKNERLKELEKASYFTCENYLFGELPQWNIKTLLILPTEELFDIDLLALTSTRLELAYYEGDTLLARGGVVYAQVENKGIVVRFPKREVTLERSNVVESVNMRLLSNGRAIKTIYFDNSGLDIDNSPLVFECDGEGEGDDKKLLANESCRLPMNLALVRVPHKLRMQEFSGSELAQENDVAVWIAINRDLSLFGEEDRFTIQLSQTIGTDQKPILNGIFSELESSPSKIYKGWPVLEFPENSFIQPAECIHICNGKSLPINRRFEQVGSINYAVKNDDGKTVLRRKFGVLPKDLSICLLPKINERPARLLLKNVSGLHYNVVSDNVRNFITRNDNEVEFHLDYVGDIQPSIFELDISSDLSIEPVRLRLPYPYLGARLIDANGQPSSKQDLVIGDLLGKQIALYPCDSYNTEFTLRLEFSGRQRLERNYIIKVGKTPVLIGLFNYLNDIQQMLGATKNQDAYIRLTIDTDTRHLSLNVRRYNGELNWQKNGEFFINDISGKQIVDGAIAEAMLLSDPKQAPVKLNERQTQGVGTGYFVIPWLMESNGPWLIYPRDNSEINFRPKLYVSHAGTQTRDETCSLHTAVKQFHPINNFGVIDIQIREMALDLDHTGWQYLSDIRYNFSQLPLSTFESWLSLSRNHKALAVAVLRLEMDEAFCQRIRDELAVIWECISLPVWAEVYKDFNGWLQEKGLPDHFVEKALSNRRELLSKVVSGFEHVSKYLCSGIESNLINVPWEKILPIWYQSLRQRHYSETDRWPNDLGFVLSEWIFEQEEIPDSIKKLSNIRYSDSVTILPIYMAYVTAGRLSIEDLLSNREYLVFEIKMISDFDRIAWYEPVHAMVVSHLLSNVK